MNTTKADSDLSRETERIKSFRTYKGGEEAGHEMNQHAVDDMLKIANLCDEKKMRQPEYFPFYDASGAQAEWDTGTWYMEIDSREAKDGSEERSLFLVKRTEKGKYEKTFSCMCSIEDAVELAEIFQSYVFRGKE